MAHHDIFYTLPAGDRTYKRYQLVSLFLQEEPGEGKGTLASTYTYTVESWGRYTICLCRPANLNHGFDFIVNIPTAYFQHDRNRNPNAPSHDDAVFTIKIVQKGILPLILLSEMRSGQFTTVKSPIFPISKPDSSIPTVSTIQSKFFYLPLSGSLWNRTALTGITLVDRCFLTNSIRMDLSESYFSNTNRYS